MNKIIVTGDTHGRVMQRLAFSTYRQGKKLDYGDYLIILGDFGTIWEDKPDSREEYVLNWLSQKPWTTIIIGGNHENWKRLNELPKKNVFGVEVGVIRSNILFIPNGTVLELAGKTIFCMGGAMSVDRGGLESCPYPGENKTWWREEIPTKEQMQFGIDNLEKCKWKVDYVFTHTMPQTYVDLFNQLNKNGWGNGPKDPTARYLDYVLNNLKEEYSWFCGHFHQNKSYGKIQIMFNEVRIIHDGSKQKV